MDDVLQFFDDERFSAVEYIDALCMQSVKTPNLNNNTHLLTLNRNLNNVINELQLYSDNLFYDMNTSFQELNKLGKAVGQYNNGPGTELGSEITRLEYNINSILNVVNGLSNDTNEIIEQYKEMNKDNMAMQTLIQLRKISTNLQKVSKLFQTAKFISTISQNKDVEKPSFAPTKSGIVGENEFETDISITPASFKESLSILSEIIEEQLELGKTQKATDLSTEDLMEKIDSLIELRAFFRNLNHYDEIYSEFVIQLEKDRKAFLEPEKTIDVKEAQTETVVTETVTKEDSKPSKNIQEPKEAVNENKGTSFGGFMNFFNKG